MLQSMHEQTHEHITLTSIERQVILVGNCSFLNGAGLVILQNATTIRFSKDP